MKKLFTLAVMMIASLTFVDAQKFAGVDPSPMDAAIWRTARNAPAKAKIIYSRPMKKDREIWGSLVPYDKMWRTGANEAPEITFYEDVNFGGKQVKAGTYSLFVIPGKSEWTFVLNSDLNQWGNYQYNESSDVVRVKGPAGNNETPVEAFSATWENQDDGSVHLILGWDDQHGRVPIRTNS
ncbi:MAG: DUF2911 domain-containing protein [Saprospiraceae bacterium]|nr:DUF2911 domain-containing protein [Saprospiraceae bacterium]